MKTQLFRGDIYIGKSPVHGYGVFAQQHFRPGDTIEECYCLVFKRNEKFLMNYFYGCQDKNLLALGSVSIANHSLENNAIIVFDAGDSVISLVASKNIAPGEEIFTNYGDGWFASRQLTEYVPLKNKLIKPLQMLLRFGVCLGVMVGGILLVR